MDNIFRKESVEEFQQALKEIIYSYTSTQAPKDSAVIKSAKDDLVKLLTDSNFDTKKVPDLLVSKDWDGERITYFMNLLAEKKTELLYASIVNQNSKYGENITNFNWLLKLVLGTSELNSFKYPLLQLILSTDCNGIQKELMYDLNKDMLLKIIDALQKLDNTE